MYLLHTDFVTSLLENVISPKILFYDVAIWGCLNLAEETWFTKATILANLQKSDKAKDHRDDSVLQYFWYANFIFVFFSRLLQSDI